MAELVNYKTDDQKDKQNIEDDHKQRQPAVIEENAKDGNHSPQGNLSHRQLSSQINKTLSETNINQNQKKKSTISNDEQM